MKMAEKKCLLAAEFIYQKKITVVDAPIDQWLAGPLCSFLYRQMEGLPFHYNKQDIDQFRNSKPRQ